MKKQTTKRRTRTAKPKKRSTKRQISERRPRHNYQDQVDQYQLKNKRKNYDSQSQKSFRDDRSDITLENPLEGFDRNQTQKYLDEIKKNDQKQIKVKSQILSKIQRQKRRKIQQEKKRRLQMFLGKKAIQQESKPIQKQTQHILDQSAQKQSNNQTLTVKIQDTQQRPPQQNKKQDNQLIDYLFKIMNGTITKQQLNKKRQEEQKKKKIQQDIKLLYKQKMQYKVKKQDAQSQHGFKVLSTNYDSQIGKNQNYLKQQFGQENQTTNKDGQKNQTKIKRTIVTPALLRLLMKDFQFLTQQRNGFFKDTPKLKFKDIGKKYKLGRSSIIKMFAQYCQDPTMKKRFQTREPSSKSRTMLELTKRRINFVQKLIRKNCTLSQRQIAAEMNLHDQLKVKRKKMPQQSWEDFMKNPYHQIAYKAVSRIMKLANLTRKKVTLIPLNRNSERTVQERYHFCKILHELVADQKNKLYFLDQCRFNLFTSRDFGWAPRGQLATKVRHNSKGKDIMLLAIIGKQGLVQYEISDSYNRGSFTIAANKLINNICPKETPQNQRIYLILDNCPIHNKDNLKHLQQTLPLTILYLPPYTPMLNPIQSWFNELKGVIKSKIYKTRIEMKNTLIATLQTFKTKSMEAYYKNIEKSIALGLKKQLFR